MNKGNKKKIFCALCMLLLFVLWTVAVSVLDVQPIGPQGSTVGFATVNRYVHRVTGVNMSLYRITDWLGLIPIILVLGFALLGMMQWIRRKDIRKVDHSILVLGGFYLAVMAVFLFFEIIVVNYRPVLIEGILEPSYPSSTTMLAICVMATAAFQFRIRIKNPVIRRCVLVAFFVFGSFMVIGRLFSGVHWITDIVGGLLSGTSLVMIYFAIVGDRK